MTTLLPYLIDFEKEIQDSKEPERALRFWLKVAWEVETCVEAAELFPEMMICPVCLEREQGGEVLHKLRRDIEH